jgi:hypothetical protein
VAVQESITNHAQRIGALESGGVTNGTGSGAATVITSNNVLYVSVPDLSGSVSSLQATDVSLRNQIDKNDRNDILTRLLMQYQAGWVVNDPGMEEGYVEDWGNTNNINTGASVGYTWASKKITWVPVQISYAERVHYLLNDDAATTTVVDDVSVGNGTATSNTTVLTRGGKLNGALYLNPATKIIIPASVIQGGAAPFTVMMWLKRVSVKTGCNVFHMGDTGGAVREFVTIADWYTGNLDYLDGAVTYNFGAACNTTNWIHIALSYNGTALCGFTNSVQAFSNDVALNLQTDAMYLNADRTEGANHDYIYDDFRYYTNDASALIATVYNGGTGTETNHNPVAVGGNMHLATLAVTPSAPPVSVSFSTAHDGPLTNAQVRLVSGAVTNLLTLSDVGAFATNGTRVLACTTNVTGWTNSLSVQLDTLNNGAGTNWGYGLQWRSN